MSSIRNLLAIVLVLSCMVAGSSQYKCEPLKIRVCQRLSYNQTVFPNFAHHRTQYEADLTIRTIAPLLNSACSPDLLYLACAYYAPVCTSYGIMVPPCRSLCRSVKRDCMPVMKRIYGNKIEWPSAWNCNKLPRRKRNKVCFGRPQRRKNARISAFL